MELVIYPDPRLRAHNRPLFKNDFSREFRQKAAKMLEIMKANDGAGLAAPQVGINQKFFVAGEHLPHQIVCNPRWIVAKGAHRFTATEGCLSLPGLTIEKERFDRIQARYQCEYGKIWSMELSGFAAHVFQHETDHLNGRLMIDQFTKVFRKECENEVR